jgi:hypothetical protein
MSVDAPPAAKSRGALATAASRAAREPLVHFLIAALALFSANSLISGTDRRVPEDFITIPEGRVQQIAESYRLLSGRTPSRAELEALVDDFVVEDIYYREAMAMGLDADDTIVRRRMRQKLEFLAEDADVGEEPSEDDLAARLKEHVKDYRLPARVSFRHVLASSDARGATAEAAAAAFLDELRSGADPDALGDSSMLPSVIPLATERSVAALFGDKFASTLFAHQGEAWFGPVVSPIGSHDVMIVRREAARDPILDEVRGKVRSDWFAARRMKKRSDFEARLRARYEVTINWPERHPGQRAPANDAGAE